MFSIVDKEGVVKEVKSIEQVQFNDRTPLAEIDGQLVLAIQKFIGT